MWNWVKGEGESEERSRVPFRYWSACCVDLEPAGATGAVSTEWIDSNLIFGGFTDEFGRRVGCEGGSHASGSEQRKSRRCSHEGLGWVTGELNCY